MPILKNYIEGTQLNQLKYSSYSSGRGPIIQKKIPTGISEQGNEFTEFGKRGDDLARIAALMTRPEGLNYLSNEKGLSQVRIKGKAQQEGKQTLLGKLVGGTLNTAKVLGSTLLQVPLNGTGTHFVKGFGERAGYLGRSYAGTVKEGGTVGDPRDLGRRIGTEQIITDLGLQTNTSAKDANYGSFGESGRPFEFRSKSIQQIEKESYNLENRVNLGHISSRRPSERKSPYEKAPQFDKIDRKNFLPPIEGFKEGDQGFSEKTQTPGIARDMVKFRFEVITPEKSVNLYFRALIDDFSDSYNSSWNEFNYVGRGETFYNYNTFNRGVQVNFKVAAMTRHELKPIYQKLNYLASTTAPTYSNGFMRGTFTKFTLGSYFYQLPGFVNSVDISWDNTYPFEIALNSPDPVTGERNKDNDVQELPMVLNVALSYTPIHTFTPQTGLYHYTTNSEVSPFFKAGDSPTKREDVAKLFQPKQQGSSESFALPPVPSVKDFLSNQKKENIFSLDQGQSGFNLI